MKKHSGSKLLCLLLAAMLITSLTLPAYAVDEPMVINIARMGDTTTMDPIFAGDNVDIWVMNLIFEGLVRSTADGRDIEPCLATSWDLSEDKCTYTFHLREGVCFSTGEPVTVDDWVYSLNRVVSREDGAWQFMVANVTDISAVDDKTLSITISTPSGSFLADLALFCCAVVPKNYYEKTDDATLANAPIGTGPFYLDSWVKQENMCFRKNGYYWDEGYPVADEINFHVVPDDNTRIMQLQAGQIDVCTGLTASGIAMVKSFPGVKLIENESTHVSYISFNYTSEKLSDVRVRQALTYATDRDAIITSVYGGIGKRCTSFIWPTAKHFNNNLPAYEYDLEKAKALLAEAGAENLELNVIIVAGDSQDLMLATVLQSQWAKAGVKLNIQQLDSSARREHRNGLTYEILFSYLTSDIADTSELMELVCYSETSDCWHLGWNGEKQEKAEALVKAAASTMDEDVRMKNYTEAQLICAEEAIIIPLNCIPSTDAVRDNIEGFYQSPLGTYMFNELCRVN